MTKVDPALLVKVAAGTFAVLAMTLAIVQLDQDEAQSLREAAVATRAVDQAPDPLAAELARCRAIIDPAAVDDACRRAWAERRARFFGAELQP